MCDLFPMAVIATADVTITWAERFTDPFYYHRTPLIVCTLIGATLGLIGCFVVLRRMALIGDALSHAVLPGVVIAFIVINATVGSLEGAAGIWGLFVGALLAGLLTSLGINLVTRHSRLKEDTAIGIVFTAMFAVGVVLISNLPRGTHFDLKCFLFGEPLAIQHEDLVTTLIVSPLVLACIVIFYRPLKLVSFDAQMAAAAGLPVHFIHYLQMALLSATVVAALRSVGVIMAVAMLITPAAIAYQLTNRLWIMLVLSASAGAISALAGIELAFALNLPPGPAMVLVAALLFVLAMAFGPEYGVVAKMLRRRRIHWHILQEDVLKSLSHLGRPADTAAVRAGVGQHATEADIVTTLGTLEQGGHVLRQNQLFQLTQAGGERAERLIRSHRLWETYLAEHDVPEDLLHNTAERLEHAHDLAEEIAAELGNPQIDPHGEPIPGPR